MLFRVTMTHTPEDCPGYNFDKMPDVVAAGDNLESLARDLGITVHFLVNAAPDHRAFALIESDSLAAIVAYVHSMPFRQDFDVTPVQHMADVMAYAKRRIAHGG
jgi:hypothetical protein